jgi:hypothetical protein
MRASLLRREPLVVLVHVERYSMMCRTQRIFILLSISSSAIRSFILPYIIIHCSVHVDLYVYVYASAACLPAYLSLCLSVCLSVCLSILNMSKLCRNEFILTSDNFFYNILILFLLINEQSYSKCSET